MKVRLYVFDIMSPEEDAKANLIKRLIDTVLECDSEDLNPCDALEYEVEE